MPDGMDSHLLEHHNPKYDRDGLRVWTWEENFIAAILGQVVGWGLAAFLFLGLPMMLNACS